MIENPSATAPEVPSPDATPKSTRSTRGFWIWTAVFTFVGGFAGWMTHLHSTTSPPVGAILGATLCLGTILASRYFSKRSGCGT
jgi:hypothetical protein